MKLKTAKKYLLTVKIISNLRYVLKKSLELKCKKKTYISAVYAKIKTKIKKKAKE